MTTLLDPELHVDELLIDDDLTPSTPITSTEFLETEVARVLRERDRARRSLMFAARKIERLERENTILRDALVELGFADALKERGL